MQLKNMITKRNYRQSSEKNLEGKQIESDEHEQNWIEKFLVTACALHDSRQHFRENMCFKEGQKDKGGWSVRAPAPRRGSFPNASLDTKVTHF